MKNILLIAVLLGGVLSAKAGLLSHDNHASEHGHDMNIGSVESVNKAQRTVNVVLKDNYFEPETIRVKDGEIIRFVVTNQGGLVHEFNIGTPELHATHQTEMLEMMQMGMLLPDRVLDAAEHAEHAGHAMQHDDPNSVLLEPGQSAELVWRFPQDTKLEFACNVPGHYQAGMVGDFILQ